MAPPREEDDAIRRHAGAHHTNLTQQERHRQFLQNLQRKKALEREAAERRFNKGQDERERGFQVVFNGANRDLGKPPKSRTTQQQQQARNPQQQTQRPSTRGATGRLLRSPGAVPIPNAAWPADDAERAPAAVQRPSQQSDEEANESDSPATAVKRNRRQWVLGEPVLLRAASGEVLQADPGGREAAQLLRTAAAPPQTTPQHHVAISTIRTEHLESSPPETIPSASCDVACVQTDCDELGAGSECYGTNVVLQDLTEVSGP